MKKYKLTEAQIRALEEKLHKIHTQIWNLKKEPDTLANRKKIRDLKVKFEGINQKIYNRDRSFI